MAIKPFQWTNLRKVSSEEVHLIDTLFEIIPATSARDSLNLKIRKMLMKHLGEKSFYYLDVISNTTYSSFLGSLPEGAVLAVIGMEPSNAKMILHVDNNLAFLLIDRLLGGIGEPSVENRPLTETEQGVLQYFIMQVLAEVWQSFGEMARLHFRFERFAFSANDIEKIGSPKDVAVSLVFKVGVGELAGFVKLIFTGDFVKKAGGITPKHPLESEYFAGKVDKYNYIKTSLWADAGMATVSSDDLAALEPGDVIIFDETGLSLKDGMPVGEVDLKVGKGEEGSLTAEITADKNIIKCRITGG